MRVDAVVSVTFSKAVDPGSLGDDSVILATPGGTRVYGTLASSNAVLTLTPSSLLTPETDYEVTVAADIESTDGAALGTAYTFGFRSVDYLRVTAVSPSDGATGVHIDTPLVLTFSASIDAGTVAGAIEVVPNTWYENQYKPTLSGTATVSGNQVTFRR